MFAVVSKKKSLPRQMSKRIFGMLSSWSFTVSDFTFKALIDFELIFMNGVS